MNDEQPVDYRPHPNTSLEVRISNAIHALNLTRPDIAALKDGQSIVCNITDRRIVGALLEDIQTHLMRESVTQALAMLHGMIDGGEECGGRDSEISDIIRILEQGK